MRKLRHPLSTVLMADGMEVKIRLKLSERREGAKIDVRIVLPVEVERFLHCPQVLGDWRTL